MLESRKRKKNYHKISSHKKSRNSDELRPGMRGYVITCSNDKERRETVMEAYRILNEYADIKYGPENIVKDNDDDKEVNIEDALQKEVSDIKKSNAKGAPRRFQNVSTKAKNVIFIRTNVKDHTNLLNNIYFDIMSTQIKKTKFCLRFLPVVCTCYAKTENIIKYTKQCIEPVFVEQSQVEIIRFSIVWKTRCNNSVKRDDVLPPILDYIFSKVEHVTDYTDPEIVVNIDVIGNICCIGMLRNYVKFKKYNLDLIVQTAENEKEVTVTDDTKTGDDQMGECENKEHEQETGEIATEMEKEVTIIDDTKTASIDDKMDECENKEHEKERVEIPTEEKKEVTITDDTETGSVADKMDECENKEHKKETVEIANEITPESSNGNINNSKHHDADVDGTPVEEEDVSAKEREIENVNDGIMMI